MLKLFYQIQYIQLFVFSIILFYSLFNLTIGNINLKNRETVLNHNANGYKLATWVNTLIPDSSKLLLEHRSVILFKQHIYSADWSYYLNNNESLFYDSIIKKIQLNYILILNDSTIRTILNLISKVIATTKIVCHLSPISSASLTVLAATSKVRSPCPLDTPSA
mgnify:CR=1 FL=1